MSIIKILIRLSQDSNYDLRLMSRCNKVLSEPSESVNVSTIGMWFVQITKSITPRKLITAGISGL